LNYSSTGKIIYGEKIPEELLQKVEGLTLGRYLTDAMKEHSNETWLVRL